MEVAGPLLEKCRLHIYLVLIWRDIWAPQSQSRIIWGLKPPLVVYYSSPVTFLKNEVTLNL